MNNLINNYKIKKSFSPKVQENSVIVDLFWASENNNFSNQILYCDKSSATLINNQNKRVINKFVLEMQDLKTCAIEQSQNGLIAVGGIEGGIYVGEINTNNTDRKEDNNNIKKHTGHQGSVNSIRFLDHFFMISGSSDSLILLWDLNSQGKYLNSYHDHSSEILGLDVCELNPNFFASASGDTTVKLWDIRDKKPCISTFKGSDSSLNCVKFVPGTFCTLAAGSEEGIIRLYDMRAYGILAEYGKKQEKVNTQGNKNNGVSNYLNNNFENNYVNNGNNNGIKANYNNSMNISNSINSICFSKSGQILFSSSNNSNVITYWNVFNPESPLGEIKHVIKILIENSRFKRNLFLNFIIII